MQLSFGINRATGRISALLDEGRREQDLFLLSHGSGAGMHHSFMESVTRAFCHRGYGVIRFQFPYMDEGRKLPDKPTVLKDCIADVIAWARETFPGRRIIGGGKSLGGRMMSQVLAESPGVVAGLVCLGFPLHKPGLPSVDRAGHLNNLSVPSLFIQGDRDRMAESAMLREALRDVPRATLSVIAGADHSFEVLKARRLGGVPVADEIAGVVDVWLQGTFRSPEI